MKHAAALVSVLVLIWGCDGEEGTEGAPCYPNQTCNAGLVCASGLCVRLPDAYAKPVDARADSADAEAGPRDLTLNDQDQTTETAVPDGPVSDGSVPDGPVPDSLQPDAYQTVCGDGKKEGLEQCDKTQFGGKTCIGLGHDGGTLACDSKCVIDTSGCYKCGDGTINGSEQCDGTKLGGYACSNLGFDGGTLTCSSTCTYDTVGCYKCGDGKVNGSEQCDGSSLGTATCKSQKYDGGSLKCSSKCTYDISACYKCGDGKKNGNEKCEAKDLGGASCKSLSYQGGTLKCTTACAFDTSGCYKCGDGKKNGSEKCDKSDLGSGTCSILSYDGGVLKCTSTCAYDTSGCFKCGDNKINGKEQCDGSQLAGKKCTSFSPYHSGTLKCTKCSFDLSSCNKCGDGTKNGSEQCDGGSLGASCKSLGYDGGTLSCTTGCAYNKTGCYKCGDKKKNGGEQCDASDFGGTTCATFGFVGTLKCTSGCKRDKSGCYTQGWKILNAGTFTMGAPKSEPCSNSYYQTQHKVTLTRMFEISAYETTQGQFQSLMGYNPSSSKTCGASCPVEHTKWDEAAAFCNALSAKKNLEKCYSCTGSGTSISCSEASKFTGKKLYSCGGYRLPTEAEWEYAYRAGTQTAYYNGPNDPNRCMDNSALDKNLDKIAWYAANAKGVHQPVGGKQPNGWGLYDMAGNAPEWCNDVFTSSLGSSHVTDPNITVGKSHVVKGGSALYYANMGRAAMRTSFYADHFGFRCVRTLK